MKGRIEISQELCKGCRFCVISCPKGVIIMGDEFNSNGYFPAKTAHPEKCTGCTLCALMCPEMAIEVWKE